jgi:two-component system chemotaxis sensor kinase CheA
MASRKQDIKAHLLAIFRTEAEEHLQAVSTSLLALDRGLPSAEARDVVESLFREVHTLKGAARSVSLMDIESLCQACESLLSRITRGNLTLSRPILQSLQEGVDGVARLLAEGELREGIKPLIEKINPGSSEQEIKAASQHVAARPEEAVSNAQTTFHAETPTKSPGSSIPSPNTIRVDIDKLDELLRQTEDLLSPKLAAQQRLQEAKGFVETVTTCLQSLDHVRAEEGRADLKAGLRKMTAQAQELLSHLVHDEQTTTGTVDSLLGEARRLRMSSASTVLDVLPRMVRDLAEEQGKDVALTMRGAALEVDRKVLEAIKGPLIHLVRNAIDHGIEPQEVRAKSGKPPQGQVAVTVSSLEANRIEICVEDDGRGIDLPRVRAAAARVGLMTSDAAQGLTDDQAVDLIYRSGLSTSPIITDISGHGLGMAIVRERAERLEGQVMVETRFGRGTRVRILLPASIATFRGLNVTAEGKSFLLPHEAAVIAVRVSSAEVESVEGHEAIRWHGHPLFVARLAVLLGLPKRRIQTEPGNKQLCVVLKSTDEHMGLLVDEILGDCEVLVKELRSPLIRVRNIAAAGLLGTGEIVLILRPSDLLKSSRLVQGRPAVPEAQAASRRLGKVLIVDDSITTRTMEKNMLEGAGYEVRVAVDGIDAWMSLKTEEFNIVVSDVDMPRMDGLDLTARIRADQALAHLPVILVTALESREDKERGIEVGANAYIVKSNFDQSNLLEIVRRLI